MFHRPFSAGIFTVDEEFRRNASERNTLSFATPRPSYLKFGVFNLDYSDDICKERCLVAIECDNGFCRVDNLQNYSEVLEKL